MTMDTLLKQNTDSSFTDQPVEQVELEFVIPDLETGLISARQKDDQHHRRCTSYLLVAAHGDPASRGAR